MEEIINNNAIDKYDNSDLFTNLWINVGLFSLVMGLTCSTWTAGIIAFISTIVILGFFCYLSQKFNKRWLLYPIITLLVAIFILNIPSFIFYEFDLALTIDIVSMFTILLQLILICHNFYLKKNNSKAKIYRNICFGVAFICLGYILILSLIYLFQVEIEILKSGNFAVFSPVIPLIISIFKSPVSLSIILAGIMNLTTAITFEGLSSNEEDIAYINVDDETNEDLQDDNKE